MSSVPSAPDVGEVILVLLEQREPSPHLPSRPASPPPASDSPLPTTVRIAEYGWPDDTPQFPDVEYVEGEPRTYPWLGTDLLDTPAGFCDQCLKGYYEIVPGQALAILMECPHFDPSDILAGTLLANRCIDALLRSRNLGPEYRTIRGSVAVVKQDRRGPELAAPDYPLLDITEDEERLANDAIVNWVTLLHTVPGGEVHLVEAGEAEGAEVGDAVTAA
ncbi:hypothetical protein C8F01DRAFT_1085081 [Mycena amicta]|nr:hypothetical protein C8F01DRAFT_1085081 [Mycena amicta]